MRSTDEQLQEVLKRSDVIKKKQAVNTRIMAATVGVGICLALLIAVARYLPLVSSAEAENGAAQYGSLLLTTSGMGYVVVGFLAFLLGLFVTLLCLYLKKRTEIKPL